MQGFHYYLHPHPNNPHYIARSTIIAALAKLAPTLKGRMVDIGSGHSRGYEDLFKAHVGEYLCVDRQYAENVDICADCYDVPLPDESVDTILSTQVLEHLDTPERMLKETYRLLKPSGNLILTAPMVWGLHEEPVDFYRYTEYGLRYLLEQAGYIDVEVQPLEGLFAVLIQMLIDEYHASWLTKHQNLASFGIGALNRVALWLDQVFPTRRLCLTYLATATKSKGEPNASLRLQSMNQPIPSDSATQASSLYDQAFFDLLLEGARGSARQVVPMILEWLQPQSVVDVGCGLGAWLSVFRELGIQDYLGVDGDYVDRSQLQIPVEAFSAKDLTQPLRLDRRFDLAISLEVAEHLPAESASTLIESLIKLSDVVLFSAAVPFQGGTGHLNEQWMGYWVKLFQQYGYVAIDCLRYRLWSNEYVQPWYIQNSLLFVKSEQLEHYPRLPKPDLDTVHFPLEVVHPKTYQSSLGYYTAPLKDQISQMEVKVEATQKALLTAQSELIAAQNALLEAKNEIAAMKTSKFWRLRIYWLRLKEQLLKSKSAS
ncbi:methyltransferase domain-containing protein [Phormidium sp. FACHB-592]|uniref:Methyltransferase domain-containing protein n=1 Tax=Stenomitos frigidus AS-A4 TaxID=2933935 RepID=A0ABV0KGY3_9CYAN|nr:methyltransferase domain-containing protein [Phormidium sp. FACHB-592]MBD2078130.1 methyltransferase domain-containing protein [Phormidium sp. FACHB-592]